jgi:hypothetical protein
MDFSGGYPGFFFFFHLENMSDAIDILGSSNVYRRFQNIPRSSWHHPQDIFQHDDQF